MHTSPAASAAASAARRAPAQRASARRLAFAQSRLAHLSRQILHPHNLEPPHHRAKYPGQLPPALPGSPHLTPDSAAPACNHPIRSAPNSDMPPQSFPSPQAKPGQPVCVLRHTDTRHDASPHTTTPHTRRTHQPSHGRPSQQISASRMSRGQTRTRLPREKGGRCPR